MVNIRLFNFSILMLFGLLIIGCSKNDDDNATQESKEEQEQVIMDNAAKVEADIMAIFEKVKSPEEMSLHLDEMKAMESVEDAWKDDGSISIKIKNGGIISWYFFPENEGGGNVVSGIRKKSVNRTRSADFALCEKKNSCIVNTIPYDQSRECNDDLDYIANMLGKKGYDFNFIEGVDVTVDFLCKKLPNYGVSVLFTHGDYKNGQHWIMTGTTYDATETQHFYEKQDYADHWPGLKYFFQDWKSNNAQLWVLTEKRNNRYVNVTYLAVSESYLKSKISRTFPSNSLMFAIACCTLKNNPSLWEVLKGKGLGCFFGYDNYVYPDTGVDGLYYLMDTMLEDFSTASEGYGIIKKGKVDSRSGAYLKYYPEGSGVCLMSLCPDNNHPHAIDLGLPSGTKWACCNVGASSPYNYGGYYAWGETKTKSVYNWNTYQYYNDDTGIVFIGSNIAGTKYDAATTNWGKSWRIPSLPEIAELHNNTTSEWRTLKGVNGRVFTGRYGGTIFLPAAGYRWGDSVYTEGDWCTYRTSTIFGDDKYRAFGWDVGQYNEGCNNGYIHYAGLSVRPVCP